MTRIPSSSTIKFHSRLWKRREGKYSFQYWPFRESGWNKKTVSWIFLQKNLITVYRINQSLENAIVTAPFYVLHARDTREEGGREGGGVRDRSFEKTRENGRGEKRGEVRTTTTFQRRSISIEPSRENGGKICSRGEEKGGKGGEKGGERSGEERKRSVAERMIKRGRKKEDEWQSGMESGKCALASFLFFFFSSFFFSFFSFSPSLRSTKPIYRFLDLRREYFRCHYRMILWCTSYCERSRGRRDGEEREWKNMSYGLWSIYPLMVNYWIDRR